jgi:hypothetical protein
MLTLLAAAFAASSFTVADLNAAAKSATDAFAEDHAEHVEHLTGFNVSKSGALAKVKVLVDHGGMAMTYNYTCHKTDDVVECQEDGR